MVFARWESLSLSGENGIFLPNKLLPALTSGPLTCTAFKLLCLLVPKARRNCPISGGSKEGYKYILLF